MFWKQLNNFYKHQEVIIMLQSPNLFKSEYSTCNYRQQIKERSTILHIKNVSLLLWNASAAEILCGPLKGQVEPSQGPCVALYWSCHTRGKITEDILGDFPSENHHREKSGLSQETKTRRISAVIFRLARGNPWARQIFARNPWARQIFARNPWARQIFARNPWARQIFARGTSHGISCAKQTLFQYLWLVNKTDSFLKKNPPTPRKSAVIFLLMWQSTPVCVLSNDGGFPTKNQRGNLLWFSLSCGRTIEDHVWPFQGESIASEIANFFFDPSKNDNLTKDQCQRFFRFLCERWQVTVLPPIYTIIHVLMQKNY